MLSLPAPQPIPPHPRSVTDGDPPRKTEPHTAPSSGQSVPTTQPGSTSCVSRIPAPPTAPAPHTGRTAEKTQHPENSESQVHPTARSKLPCHPNINETRSWAHPKVLSCTILKKAQSRPLGTSASGLATSPERWTMGQTIPTGTISIERCP